MVLDHQKPLKIEGFARNLTNGVLGLERQVTNNGRKGMTESVKLRVVRFGEAGSVIFDLSFFN
jgi:hypothetical protein